MPVPVRIGRVVQYNDANGVTLAAIITAVRDAVAGKVRLSVSGLYCSAMMRTTAEVVGSISTMPPLSRRGEPGKVVMNSSSFESLRVALRLVLACGWLWNRCIPRFSVYLLPPLEQIFLLVGKRLLVGI